MERLLREHTIKLIGAFDGGASALIDICGQPITGIAQWDLKRFFDNDPESMWKPWLRKIGYSGVYPSYYNESPKLVSVAKDGDRQYGYCCLQTLDWRKLTLDALSVWEINEATFLKYLCDLFLLPEYARSYAVPDIPGVLWNIGTIEVKTGKYLPIYLVRGLHRHLKRVVECLSDTDRHGLLLSTGQQIPELIRWPKGVVVKRLSDVFEPHSIETVVDLDWVNAVAIGSNEKHKENGGLVSFDEVRSVLSIAGKSDWYVKGDRRVQVVKYMVDQAKLGRWEIPAKEILEKTKRSGQVGGAKRLSSLFNEASDWRSYIANPRRGMYSFNLEP